MDENELVTAEEQTELETQAIATEELQAPAEQAEQALPVEASAS